MHEPGRSTGANRGRGHPHTCPQTPGGQKAKSRGREEFPSRTKPRPANNPKRKGGGGIKSNPRRSKTKRKTKLSRIAQLREQLSPAPPKSRPRKRQQHGIDARKQIQGHRNPTKKSRKLLSCQFNLKAKQSHVWNS